MAWQALEAQVAEVFREHQEDTSPIGLALLHASANIRAYRRGRRNLQLVGAIAGRMPKRLGRCGCGAPSCPFKDDPRFPLVLRASLRCSRLVKLYHVRVPYADRERVRQPLAWASDHGPECVCMECVVAMAA